MDNFLSQKLEQSIGMPGGSELLLILLIVIVVFGHNRIPQLGEALGKGIKNFRKSFSKDTETTATALPVTEAPVTETPVTETPVAEKLAEAAKTETNEPNVVS